MAIISRTPCAYSRPQPTRLRPMRRVRLLKADPLDRWLATVDFLDPVSPRPLCRLYGTVCQLSMAVYDHVAGYTEALSLDRHAGSGMSDIPVPAPSAKMLFWARDATIGTSTHRIIARRCKNIELRKIKSRILFSIFSLYMSLLRLFCNSKCDWTELKSFQAVMANFLSGATQELGDISAMKRLVWSIIIEKQDYILCTETWYTAGSPRRRRVSRATGGVQTTLQSRGQAPFPG
ncbi:hypothetical protein B0H13DRAFT_1863389 [Mycena leptocephala]|nr:hypothetical protein B0H13DRAFT_1863389 [Mycena leptocephala]